MRRLRCETGQAVVITVLLLGVLMGMAALAIDVGSWFHAKRALQAVADSAALAGAQALPESPANAETEAIAYANKNGGTLGPSDISFSTEIAPNDTISVHMKEQAPGFFSKVFGLSSVTVSVSAAARSDNASQARYVAPITVNRNHPMLQCSPPPCSGPTQIDLADLKKPKSYDAAGSFGLINLDQSSGGTVGSSTLSSWITSGFDAYLSVGTYNAVPSTMFNSSNVRDSLAARIGQVLLFPVYSSLINPGSNAEYTIVGWVGFRVTGFDPTGNTGTVYGEFTRWIADGIQESSSGQLPDYGVRTVQLVN